MGLDYRLRPHKQTERKILVEILNEIIEKKNNYSYVGFGAEYYLDFILFHEKLNINNMISIENEKKKEERCKYNIPYNCIKLKMGSATEVIPSIKFEENTICWLDFTTKFSKESLSDLLSLASRIKKNSVILATFNIEHRMNRDEFTETFKKYMPLDQSQKLFSKKFYNELVRKTADNAVRSVFSERMEKDMEIINFFDFVYKDGVKMLTIGYFVSGADEILNIKEKLKENIFAFRASSFNLEIDNLTSKETQCLKRFMPEGKEDEFLPFCHTLEESNNIMNQFKNVYKYYPAYSEIVG